MCRMRRLAPGILVLCFLPIATAAWIEFPSNAKRLSATDLEISGDLAAMPAGTTRFLSREQLLILPLVTYTVTDDPNFSGATVIRGVLLEELLHRLGSPKADLVVAVCDDKYRAHYTREYLALRHPVLVLEVNGKPPAGWPKDAHEHQFDMGPYMVSHAKFISPGAGDEEAQIPWGVVGIEFQSAAQVFGAIAPRGPHAHAADVQAGFHIARASCFRCHMLAAQSGQKSWVPWEALAGVAAAAPDWFAAYVRNPQSKNPQSQMPGSPQYDAKTMRALTAYFHTFAQPEK